MDDLLFLHVTCNETSEHVVVGELLVLGAMVLPATAERAELTAPRTSG